MFWLVVFCSVVCLAAGWFLRGIKESQKNEFEKDASHSSAPTIGNGDPFEPSLKPSEPVATPIKPETVADEIPAEVIAEKKSVSKKSSTKKAATKKSSSKK